MSNDVLITPASRKIELKDSNGNVDAKIETDSSGNLLITNAGGDISIGDTTSDVFIGDGTNSVDIVFEQNGEIRGTSGVVLTLGDANTTLRTGTDLDIRGSGGLQIAGTEVIDSSGAWTGSSTGLKGEPGAKGATGAKGDTGTATKGQKGEAGAKGATGAATKGQKGEVGVKGATGAATKGQKGEAGAKGQKGEVGQKGAAGSYPTNASGNWWNNGPALVGTDGVMEVGRYMDWHFSDTATSDYTVRLENMSNNGLKISNSNGYLEYGPMNGAHSHFQTDRGSFYFNKEIRVDTGVVSSYNEDLYLRRAASSSNQIQISDGYVTVSDTIHAQDGLRLAQGGWSEDPEGVRYDWGFTGQGTDTSTWWKVCTVTQGSGLYSALNMTIELVSQASNFGATNEVDISHITAMFYRSSGTQDSPNNAVLLGNNTDDHELRIVKTATGTYELQLRMKVNYRDAILRCQVQSTNGGDAVFTTNDTTAGSTSGTIYTMTTPTDSSGHSKHIFPIVKASEIFLTHGVSVGGSEVISSSGTWTGSSSGLKGEPGAKGATGQKGDTGAKGAPGAKGATGASVKGQKGEAGAKGATGAATKGQKGEAGAKGATGAATKGQKGEAGAKGATGAATKGQKGEIGLTDAPYGAVPAYSNSNVNTITWNATEEAMALQSSSDAAIGAAFPAFRVNLASNETHKLSVKIKGSVADSDGIYLRVYEYNAALPSGKVAVSNDAAYSLVQEDTSGKTNWYENGAITTSWVTKEYTYTPTSGAQWASLVILNWSGYGSNTLYIRDPMWQLIGSSGAKGQKGAAGAKGATGAATKGQKGEAGASVKGSTGAKGEPGAKGQKGESVTGQKGATGAKGAPGAKGATGAKGEPGASVKGQKGAAGAKGATGTFSGTTNSDINLGDGTANTRLLVKKADNNVSDHIQFYNGTTRIGEIGCQDTSWLRINQVTAKNIYTPRYIRADAGFFVDGGANGIDGNGRVKAPNGTVSAPSISFSSDTNNGLYRVTTDTIGMSTGGAQRQRWHSSGTNVTGSMTASSNVTAYSDERLKENIETLDGSKVLEMRGVSFIKDGEAGSGVVAQELEKIAPELVQENDDGYKSVAYGNLVGYLIEAIKDLKEEIEELKNGNH